MKRFVLGAVLILVALSAGAQVGSPPPVRSRNPFDRPVRLSDLSTYVQFSERRVISVREYGAIPDDSTDDTADIQAAITACGVSGQCVIEFQCGTYDVTDTITIARHRVNLIGCGQQATVIDFAPASGGKAAFLFDNSSTIVQGGISGFGFTSSDTALQKIMVKFIDADVLLISDIGSSEGTWTGNTSIGIQSFGRQFVRIEKVTIAADIPIDFQQNPRAAGLDTDHDSLESLYLVAGGNNPNINVDDSTVLSNFTLEKFSFNKGGYGFYFPKSTAAASAAVSIRNGRWEQEQLATGYMIYLGSTNGGIRNVTIENVYGGSAARGIYLRRVAYVRMTTIKYAGTGVALDVDSTVAEMSWCNCDWGQVGASASVTGQTLVWASNVSVESTMPLRPCANYTQDANTNTNILVTSIREGTNTAKLGYLAAPAFAAGDFTASGTMTWTVAAGDVGDYSYSIIGKRMRVWFAIFNTTVGGVVSNALRIAIPEGKTAARQAHSNISVNDNAAGFTGSRCSVGAGEAYIVILKDFAGANWTLSTDQTTILGQIEFEFQ